MNENVHDNIPKMNSYHVIFSIILNLLIAKYHQYRIANAIFKMTFSHLNMTANERRRQEHSSQLRR